MTPPDSKPTIDLVYFNAGGGHRAAATALEAVIHAQRRPWQVRCVNLFDVLDPRSQFLRFTGMAPEDVYNKRLAKGWTLGFAQELKLLQGMIRLGHAPLVQRLAQHWRVSQPDMVVSLIPNFNRPLFDSLAAARPGAPFVTVLTDMADHPPNFWIEPGLAQHLVCGTAKAAQQARSAGCAEALIHTSSGMIIRPDFYEPLLLDRRSERARLGLDPDRPTGVVMFGGQGSMAMHGIAKQLDDVQLILMCGHHRPLARKLRALPSTAPRAVVEFTPEVRRYLRLGDFFIGKPGPGSLSEAVQQGLPVVTVRNTWTMPQERYNTEWVLEHGLGRVARSMRNIRPTVLALLEQLDTYKANVRRIDNRAVFEVPEILAGILGAGVRSSSPRHLQFTPLSPALPSMPVFQRRAP
ncbi:MAG: galactosyldiacylglycerol synthase [Burkholderiales bacterium]|nr:galactosyldiacylglycerol synthase [Burkholderiales bacterium]